MAEPERRFLERRIVSAVLRVGVAIATILMLVGVTMAGFKARLRAHPVRLGQLASRLGQGHPSAFMELGILVLLATPIVRVLLLAVGWSVARDWRFAAVAAAVALLLATGIVLGRV